MTDHPSHSRLAAFLTESNRIEGICIVKAHELKAAQEFLGLSTLCIADLEEVCRAFQPDAVLRVKEGQDVYIGNHVPPAGGPFILREIERILTNVEEIASPFIIHRRFEDLHPFTDGNGRTGRILWLWQMVNQYGYQLGRLFLHQWYYQSLAASRS